MNNNHYDVFLSRKSEDAHLAKEIYDFLTEKGLKVFDSTYSLPQLGNADYQRSIDSALDNSTHMIVVGSSVENICSPWVDAEWRLFISEKRAGNKNGNILSVISKDIQIRELPASLRFYEVIFHNTQNFDRVYAYVKKNAKDSSISEIQIAIASLPNINDKTLKAKELYLKLEYQDAFELFMEASEEGDALADYFIGRMFEYGEHLPNGVTEEDDLNILIRNNLIQNIYSNTADNEERIVAFAHKKYDAYDDDTIFGDGRTIKTVPSKGPKSILPNIKDYKNTLRDETNQKKFAKMYYQKCAENGNLWGYYGLAGLLESSDKKLANEYYIKMFEMAKSEAKKGDAFANYVVGRMYHLGLGIETNYPSAIKFYKEAAKMNFAYALHNLAYMYENGQTPTTDFETALMYYSLAVIQKCFSSKYRLYFLFFYQEELLYRDTFWIERLKKVIQIPLDIVFLFEQLHLTVNERNLIIKRQKYEEAAQLRDREKKIQQQISRARDSWWLEWTSRTHTLQYEYSNYFLGKYFEII